VSAGAIQPGHWTSADGNDVLLVLLSLGVVGRSRNRNCVLIEVVVRVRRAKERVSKEGLKIMTSRAGPYVDNTDVARIRFWDTVVLQSYRGVEKGSVKWYYRFAKRNIDLHRPSSLIGKGEIQ